MLTDEMAAIVEEQLDVLNAAASELDGRFDDGHFMRVEWYQPGDSDTPWRIVEADENGLQVQVVAKFPDAEGVGVWLALYRVILIAVGRI